MAEALRKFVVSSNTGKRYVVTEFQEIIPANDPGEALRAKDLLTGEGYHVTATKDPGLFLIKETGEEVRKVRDLKLP